MELKIWVDGIKRVVCGVTDNTTCQDIVIALAQALGRTGRFTLIEKWRDSERPLAPNECPLLALQKWGEFANEVKLLLYESGTIKKKKHAENDKIVQRMPDKFTHNFTPPLTTSEALVHGSLTFHGGRNQDINTIKKHEQQNLRNVQNSEQVLGGVDEYQFSNFSPPLQVHVNRSGNSWPCSTMVQQKQQPQEQKQQQQMPSAFPEHVLVSLERQRPSPLPAYYHSNQLTYFNEANPRHISHDSVHTQQKLIPNHQYLYQNQQKHSNNVVNKPSSNVPTANGPLKLYVPGLMNSSTTSYFSGLALVQPEPSNPDSIHSETRTASHSDIPNYTKICTTSNKQATIKEFDLHSNFPHVTETSPKYLLQEYNVPGVQGHNNYRNGRSWEDEERVKLLRLVTMQNERIKMQDSQLAIINTELSSRDQKFEDLELELSHITEELAKMLKHCEEQIKEIVKLDDGSLIQEMEAEKQNERDIKKDITSLRTRLEKCENDLTLFSFKVKKCKEDMDLEDEVLKNDEKRRKEEEIKIQTQVSELRKVLDERFKDSEAQAKLFNKTEEDLKAANDKILQNSIDLISLEKELKTENLKFCHTPKDTENTLKSGKINGEADIKDLEGIGSQNIKQNKILSSPLTLLDMTMKNGVWV